MEKLTGEKPIKDASFVGWLLIMPEPSESLVKRDEELLFEVYEGEGICAGIHSIQDKIHKY